MPSIGTLGGTLPSGPKSLKIKCQAFLHNGSTGLKWPTPASPPVTDNHHGAGAKGQLDVAGRSENFLVDTGATYSVLTSYSGAFSSQTCIILDAIGKTIAKRFTQALLCFWDVQIFFHQFLVVHQCPTPLLGRDILIKLGTTLEIGRFSASRALQLLVTTEEPITPSPIERDQKQWEGKINPRCGTRGLLDEPTKLNWSSLSSEIPLSFQTGNNIPSEEKLRKDYSL